MDEHKGDSEDKAWEMLRSDLSTGTAVVREPYVRRCGMEHFSLPDC